MCASLASDQSFEKAVEARLARELGAAIAEVNNTDHSIEHRVHQARLATKELRAFLRLIRPAFRDYREVNAALRDAARQLAHHRDSAVRARLLHELFKSSPENGLAAFSDAIAELAGSPPGIEEQERQLAGFSRDIGALAANAALWRVEPKAWSCIADGATRTYRAARRAMADARKTKQPADFHEWRKYVKYHARQLALLSKLSSGPTWRRRKAVSRLGELLGRHHDLEALYAHLRDEVRLSETDLVAFRKAIDPLQDDLVRIALREGKVRFRRKPGAFRRNVRKALAQGAREGANW